MLQNIETFCVEENCVHVSKKRMQIIIFVSCQERMQISKFAFHQDAENDNAKEYRRMWLLNFSFAFACYHHFCMSVEFVLVPMLFEFPTWFITLVRSFIAHSSSCLLRLLNCHPRGHTHTQHITARDVFLYKQMTNLLDFTTTAI